MVVSIIERQFIIAMGESKIKKIKIREILLVFAVGGWIFGYVFARGGLGAISPGLDHDTVSYQQVIFASNLDSSKERNHYRW